MYVYVRLGITYRLILREVIFYYSLLPSWWVTWIMRCPAWGYTRWGQWATWSGTSRLQSKTAQTSTSFPNSTCPKTSIWIWNTSASIPRRIKSMEATQLFLDVQLKWPVWNIDGSILAMMVEIRSMTRKVSPDSSEDVSSKFIVWHTLFSVTIWSIETARFYYPILTVIISMVLLHTCIIVQ